MDFVVQLVKKRCSNVVLHGTSFLIGAIQFGAHLHFGLSLNCGPEAEFLDPYIYTFSIYTAKRYTYQQFTGDENTFSQPYNYVLCKSVRDT